MLLPRADHLWDHRKATAVGRQPYRQGVYSLFEILEDVNDGHNVLGASSQTNPLLLA